MLAPPGFVGNGSGGVVNAVVGVGGGGDMTDESVVRTTTLSVGLEVELEMRGVSAGLKLKLLVLDVVMSSGPTSMTKSSFSVTGSNTGGGW